MFAGVLALLERSLRTDARSWPVHLARFGLTATIYIGLIVVRNSRGSVGAPGLQFFSAIIWMNLIYMTLLGIGFFSTTISEEKEEETLGLMQMAGISPLGILLGKVGGRLVQAVLLIAVQYPFTLLAVTMGGVLSHQIQAAFVGMAAYTILLAGLGVLCSTISSQNRGATALTTLCLAAYAIIPFTAAETSSGMIRFGIRSSTLAPLLTQIGSVSIFMEANNLLATGYGESLWTVQVISNISMGFAFFVLSWILFGICNRNQPSESATVGAVSRFKRRSWFFSAGRPGSDPFSWKDFHWIGGGGAGFILRIVTYVAGSLIWWQIHEFYLGAGQIEMAIGFLQFVLLWLIAIEFSQAFARSISEEIRGQTLSLLSMLPTSMTYITLSKLLGTLIAVSPGLLVLGVVSLILPEGSKFTWRFFADDAGWFLILHFILMPHLAMVCATLLRWGHAPLAIGLSIGAAIAWVAFFESARIPQTHGLVKFACFVMIGICFASYAIVQVRLKSLATKG